MKNCAGRHIQKRVGEWDHHIITYMSCVARFVVPYGPPHANHKSTEHLCSAFASVWMPFNVLPNLHIN